ncbi:MAG TPA: RDD family protein [Kiritimatiellia bacterium]|nr:RDD family protein [Kiritimatiellia bacterium]HMP35025.1 RDD family protein [Kiritimatiellia bacterium]
MCSKTFSVPAVDIVVKDAHKLSGELKDCPYCRSAINTGDNVVHCPECGTPHHRDCWEENGGCTIYGCRLAPPDEEKISLTDSPTSGGVPADGAGLSQDNGPRDFGETGPQARPWVRYWARYIDILIFALLVGVLLQIIMPELLEINDIIFGIILTLVYTFFEATMLTSWGTTPGKAILGVSIRKDDGSKPSYGDALSRSMSVWAGGMGCGIPVVTLIAHISAYNKLSREGITSWDANGGYLVLHKKVGFFRVFAVIAIFFVFLMLISLGQAQ